MLPGDEASVKISDKTILRFPDATLFYTYIYMYIIYSNKILPHVHLHVSQ